MKNDREFLDGMWEKVSQMEYEEMQIKSAKIRQQKIMATNIAIFLSVIALFVFFIIEKPSSFQVYIIAPILVVSAYLLDKIISGENKEKSENENKWGGIRII